MPYSFYNRCLKYQLISSNITTFVIFAESEINTKENQLSAVLLLRELKTWCSAHILVQSYSIVCTSVHNGSRSFRRMLAFKQLIHLWYTFSYFQHCCGGNW